MTFNNDHIKCKFPKAAAIGRGRNYFSSGNGLYSFQGAVWHLELSVRILDRMQLIVLISYAGNPQIPKALVFHFSA